MVVVVYESARGERETRVTYHAQASGLVVPPDVHQVVSVLGEQGPAGGDGRGDLCVVVVLSRWVLWPANETTQNHHGSPTDPRHPRDAARGEGEKEEGQPLLGALELLAPVLAVVLVLMGPFVHVCGQWAL